MPFLQQGQSATVTLTAGQSIAVGAPVDSSANVLIPLNLPSGPSAVVSNTTQTFGPYANGATITVVAARGQIEYQTGAAPVVGGGGSLTPSAAAAVTAMASTAGNFTVNSRDGLGRATSYTDNSGTTYTVTYGNFGPVTVSGGGLTRTYAYNAAGLLTGYSAA